MNKEKADEVMSKVLSEWDERYGVENCSAEVIAGLYETLLASPHDDGLMRVSLIESSNKTYLVPFEDIILFGLNGSEVESYESAGKGNRNLKD